MRFSLLLWAVGCTSGSQTVSEAVSFDLDLGGLQAMDPKLSGEPLWPMTLNVQESPTDLDCWANVWAESEQGQTVALVPPTALNAMDTIQWAWNGRDEKGLSFDPRSHEW